MCEIRNKHEWNNEEKAKRFTARTRLARCSGSFLAEYGGRLNKWDETERAKLMAQLDAACFLLYGIDRDDMESILSTFKGIHDPNPLLPRHGTTAQYILQRYAEMSFPT